MNLSKMYSAVAAAALSGVMALGAYASDIKKVPTSSTSKYELAPAVSRYSPITVGSAQKTTPKSPEGSYDVPAKRTPTTKRTLSSTAEYDVQYKGQVPILMFHKFGWGENRMTCSPTRFKNTLQDLYDRGYHLITFEEAATGNYQKVPGKSPAVLTFDDGTRDEFDYRADGSIDNSTAVGMLEDFKRSHPSYRVTGTFFVNMGGKKIAFEDEATERKKLLFLMNNGYEIGSHGSKHFHYARQSLAAIQEDIELFESRIKTVLPEYHVKSFAYPFGDIPSAAAQELVNSYYENTAHAWGGIAKEGKQHKLARIEWSYEINPATYLRRSLQSDSIDTKVFDAPTYLAKKKPAAIDAVQEYGDDSEDVIARPARPIATAQRASKSIDDVVDIVDISNGDLVGAIPPRHSVQSARYAGYERPIFKDTVLPGMSGLHDDPIYLSTMYALAAASLAGAGVLAKRRLISREDRSRQLSFGGLSSILSGVPGVQPMPSELLLPVMSRPDFSGRFSEEDLLPPKIRITEKIPPVVRPVMPPIKIPETEEPAVTILMGATDESSSDDVSDGVSIAEDLSLDHESVAAEIAIMPERTSSALMPSYATQMALASAMALVGASSLGAAVFAPKIPTQQIGNVYKGVPNLTHYARNNSQLQTQHPPASWQSDDCSSRGFGEPREGTGLRWQDSRLQHRQEGDQGRSAQSTRQQGCTKSPLRDWYAWSSNWQRSKDPIGPYSLNTSFNIVFDSRFGSSPVQVGW